MSPAVVDGSSSAHHDETGRRADSARIDGGDLGQGAPQVRSVSDIFDAVERDAAAAADSRFRRRRALEG
jgi:hypothetical protein